MGSNSEAAGLQITGCVIIWNTSYIYGIYTRKGYGNSCSVVLFSIIMVLTFEECNSSSEKSHASRNKVTIKTFITAQPWM